MIRPTEKQMARAVAWALLLSDDDVVRSVLPWAVNRVFELEAEDARWTARIKLLEGRLARITNIAEGRDDAR